MTDPAAVLRAAADLAEQRARAADEAWGGGRWNPGYFTVGPVVAEHIAAADPAFMLTVAAWWRYLADWPEVNEEPTGHLPTDIAAHKTAVIRRNILGAALPSALAYLRQDTP